MKPTLNLTPHRATRLALLAGLGVALLTGAPARAQQSIFDDEEAKKGNLKEVFGAADPRGASFVGKAARLTPAERWGIDVGRVPEKRLERLDTEALQREDGATPRVKGGMRVSVGRGIALAAVDGNWYELAGGGHVWAAEVVSTEALGLRLHFAEVALPHGAELAVYAPVVSAPERGVVKSGFSRFDPDRNVEFHSAAADEQAPEFWTGTHFGDRVRIELYLPAGVAASSLPFKIDQLQHLYRDPLSPELGGLVTKAAGPCHNDPNCFPEWGDVAKAVARVLFVDGGSGFLCTGTLINNLKQDFNPFWLTANHCIDSGAVASTVDLFWFYQTDHCNGTAPSPGSVPQSLGATLVSTTATSDGSLLQIEGALPPGLFWTGWTGNAVPDGLPGACIHHPAGDFKRISFGDKGNAANCPNNNWVRVDWTDGPTEPGSSGSGVFRGDTQQLYGTLTGGPSACGQETFDCYGSFVSHYNKFKNALKAGGSDDSSEQNDSCSKARLVKAGTLKSRVVKVLDEDWYKASVAKNKTLHIHLAFTHANGDIDLQFFPACGGDPFVVSVGTTDEENIDVTNVSGKTLTGWWRVFLGDADTRNTYNQTVTIN